MSLLKPATNGTAFLKLGMLGFEGSGKTFTAVDIAIGMTKLLKGKKVAFYDTEKGSDFHIQKFKDAGLELFVVKSRSFPDLVNAIKEAESNGFSFVIIDSITHVWRDLTASYLKKKNKSFLTMKDWGVLKAEWAQYTDLYVNSKISIAMLGRAGHEYDMSEDEDGNQEISKSGTKMKVETETGFEPDLLLEMFKSPKMTSTQNKKGVKKVKRERGFINKCVVLKDRTDLLNGKEIESPKFKDFMPVIKFLNIGGEHLGVDTTRNSEAAFKDSDWSWTEKQKRRDIALETLQETLILAGLDGRSEESKKKRTEMLITAFGTSAKTALENMDPKDLEDGVQVVRKLSGLEKDPTPPKNNAAEDQLPF
jgi:hypothetical protein